jgi:hypothetical protein
MSEKEIFDAAFGIIFGFSRYQKAFPKKQDEYFYLLCDKAGKKIKESTDTD